MLKATDVVVSCQLSVVSCQLSAIVLVTFYVWLMYAKVQCLVWRTKYPVSF